MTSRLVYISAFVFAFIPENLQIYTQPNLTISRWGNLGESALYIVFIFLALRPRELRMSRFGFLYLILFCLDISLGYALHHSIYYIVVDAIGLSIVLFYDVVGVNCRGVLSTVDIDKLLRILVVANILSASVVTLLQLRLGPVYDLNDNYLFFGFFISLYLFQKNKTVSYLVIVVLYIVEAVFRAKRATFVLLVLALLLPVAYLRKRVTYLVTVFGVTAIALYVLRIKIQRLYLFTRFTEFLHLHNSIDYQTYGYAWGLFLNYVSGHGFASLVGGGMGQILELNFFGTGAQNYFIDDLFTTAVYKMGLVGIAFIAIFYIRLISLSIILVRRTKFEDKGIGWGVLFFILAEILSSWKGLTFFYARSMIPFMLLVLVLDAKYRSHGHPINNQAANSQPASLSREGGEP